jgi:outer membrane protein assembly factor BamB
VADGIVYIGSSDGGLYALDARNGRQRLRYPAIQSVVSSPAVLDKVVYCCTADGSLLALDGWARNWFGESKFRIPWQVLHLYGDLKSPPPPSGYLWSIESEATSPSSPVLAGSSIYFGVGKNVVSVNLENHQKQWEFATGGIVSSACWSAPGLIYAVGSDGRLYVLDAATGEKLRDVLIGGSITSAPLLVNGTVYISSEDGNLYAVN